MTDATRALTGEVREVRGSVLTLVRPSGHAWEATVGQCWTASPEERASMTPRGAVRIISTSPRGGDSSDGSGPAT
ncbi:hypothetical protein ABZ958_10450 [Streptomyces sp. NPDC046237]|uniref:hypothetical protein n=1 Tax=Streptomyces sp. NPDC046237 TaxID=3154914 RepID=UPI003400C10B